MKEIIPLQEREDQEGGFYNEEVKEVRQWEAVWHRLWDERSGLNLDCYLLAS